MSYESEIKRSILKNAIILFGDRGFSGVTTRTLAKEAGASEASIFKHFRSKELLFGRALHEVIDSMEHAMGKILVDIYSDSHSQEPRQFAMQVVTGWYMALSSAAARLLQQVLMADSFLHDKAYSPTSRVAEILAGGLDRKGREEPRTRLRESVDILVSALFQYKVTQHSRNADAELEIIKVKISNWLDDLLTGNAP